MLNSIQEPLAGTSAALLDMLARTQGEFAVGGENERFELLFDGAPLLLCTRDLRGKFMRLSASWSGMFGFRAGDLRGTPLLTMIHPEDVWATHDIMQGIGARGVVTGFSNRYRGQDGVYHRLEWTAKLFGDRVFGAARPVSRAPLPPPPSPVWSLMVSRPAAGVSRG